MELSESRSSISSARACGCGVLATSRYYQTMSRVATLALTVAACGDSKSLQPSQTTRDTLIINSQLPVEIARWMTGSSLAMMTSLRLSPASGVAHVIGRTAIACDTIGDALVELKRPFVARSAIVRCRPIGGFRIPPAIRIPLGSQPVWLHWPDNAVGIDGRPVTLFAGTVGVLDTSVVRLADGRLIALRVGATGVEFEYSGLRNLVGVEVYEVVSDDPFQLVGGELRSWRLGPGRYQVELRLPESSDASELLLGYYNGNCATGREGALRLYCVFYSAGAVVLSNTDQRPNVTRSGRVRITRHALN